jgi:ribosomal protein S18 acetylase RimI-like enzyme
MNTEQSENRVLDLVKKMDSGMNIRQATPDDALAISNIRVAAWRGAYQAFMPAEFLSALNPEQGLNNWRERLCTQSENWVTFVAEEDGTVVGFVVVGKPRHEAQENVAELWALNVHPSCWRRGIGRALTHHATEVANSMHHGSIELWCIRGNIAAQNVYESCGFRMTEQCRSSSQLTGTTLHEVLYAKAF